MQRPYCHSDLLQRVEVLYSQGTSYVQTTSRVSGMTSGGHYVSGTAHQTGTQQTALAQSIAPPQRPNAAGAGLPILISIGMMLDGFWRSFGINWWEGLGGVDLPPSGIPVIS